MGFKVPVPTALEDFLLFFPTVHERIEEERKAGGGIYLHCTAGVYRTPTFAMAHLIGGEESVEEAETLVRQAHKPTWDRGRSAIDQCRCGDVCNGLCAFGRDERTRAGVRTVTITAETGTNRRFQLRSLLPFAVTKSVTSQSITIAVDPRDTEREFYFAFFFHSKAWSRFPLGSKKSTNLT